MIDHQRRLIFIHIARTGGTSIEAACVGQDWWNIQSQTKHLSAHQSRLLYGEDVWRSYFKFTVVRNPWDRAISLWFRRAWSASPRQRPIEDLEAFLLQLRPHKHEKYNSLHFHEIINDDVDCILRYESLQIDFSSMLESLGYQPVTLPHLESTSRGPYQMYYDPTTQDLVREIWALDIQRWNYTFE